MTHEQEQKILEQIEKSIRTTVNGKIDVLRADFNAYAKEDMEWKESAKPAIEMWTNINGFGKIASYGLTVLMALGASWELIKWVAGLIQNK